MRRTPPVVVHLQASRAVQAVVAGIAALTVAGLAGWALSHQPQAWPVWLVVPPAAVWAWREAATLPRRLRWDGQAWWLLEPGRRDETAVQLDVLIDLDAWLLLRARPGPRWLPVSRGQQGPHWGALRATLYSAPTRAPEA